jgi:uridine kinase
MNAFQVVEAIQKLSKPKIVAISGFGGSGKSTFAKLIASELQAPIVGIDSFFTSANAREYERWEVIDYLRLEREVLHPFILGKSILSYGEFNWEKNEVTATRSLLVNDILIVEGVGLLRPELKQYFTYTIWIECPLEVAIERGKRRDREEYGVPQDELWEGIWCKNDRRCFQEFAPLENADCIISTYDTKIE